MKTYGTVTRRGPTWRIKCEPHVMIRLKRTFERVSKSDHGVVVMSDTLENARELEWFLERFPMKVEEPEYLARRAAAYKAKIDLIARITSAGYEPPQFDLAIPARKYQRVSAELLLRSGRLLLADDVGLGKTLSAICTFQDKRTLPALVVTLTHLPRQWESEIKKFAPNLRTHIVKTGTVYDIAKPGAAFPDVVIINYHKLTGWADSLAPHIKSIVFDEIQELRTGPGSLKYNAARHFSRFTKFRMGLSATPIYNYGAEIFNVVDILGKDTLGTRDEFVREWCSGGKIVKGKQRLADPKAFGTYLRDQGIMLRRTRTDVGRELPELTKVPHFVDADLAELQKVESAATELAKIILRQGGAGVDKMRAAEELSWRLRQATGIAKAAFVAEFVRLLVESGEQVVLFGWHHEVYGLWKERLQEYAPAIFTGQESVPQKEEAKRRFVSGETPILMMSLRAGAGIDGLQGHCRTVVFGELDWSPGVHEQCIGRIHRDGQGEPVVAYFLISEHGSDPVVADVLGVKRAQIEGIRDPHAPLMEALAQDSGNVRKLAEDFLKQRGITIPSEPLEQSA